MYHPARLRVVQAEKELKAELEVKLAVSSLVCTVADNASTHRLEKGSSEVVRLEEKLRRAEAFQKEGGLRAELEKTKAVVAKLKVEIASVGKWQTSVDDLELKMMSRIEELKAMVEVRQMISSSSQGGRKEEPLLISVFTPTNKSYLSRKMQPKQIAKKTGETDSPHSHEGDRVSIFSLVESEGLAFWFELG